MTKITLSLFIMRASVAAFFAVWALEKFLKPDTTAGIWSYFYGFEGMPAAGSYAIGVFQFVMVAAFLVWGRMRWLSAGTLMVMHAGSTLSTWAILIDPYSGSNHLFWAAVPTLGALIALFILRDEDTLFTVGRDTLEVDA